MTASIGAYTFLIFALANVIFLPFIYFFYPETAGTSHQCHYISRLTQDRSHFGGTRRRFCPCALGVRPAKLFSPPASMLNRYSQRRPTIIAAELPKLTEHQIQEMTDRYEIHGGAAEFVGLSFRFCLMLTWTSAENADTFGAPVNQDVPDTTLPPKEAPNEKTPRRESGVSTRVATPEGPFATGNKEANSRALI